MNGQLTIFDELYPKFKITKPIRLIEFFAGYGSQALALKYLGVKFEHWKICEWAVKSIQAYKDIHFTDVNDDWNKGFKIEDLQEHLFNLGISSNYNEPMTLKQIQRLPEKQLRQIHNNICNTNNLVNIQQVKGKDLEIEDKEDYCYILTYSFPCQDLSLAGKGKGMSDTSTRSGMLWEVERILSECKELDTLPQILLMENVPQVHGVDNVEDFNKWQLRLEELGYKNYFQDLIATDYGIPQTRNRCFMVSILGDYNYTFPKKQELKLKLKDMLENNVDEKYFISNKMLQGMINTNFNSYKLESRLQDLDGAVDTLTTATGSRCPHAIPITKDTENYIEWEDGKNIQMNCRAWKDKVGTLNTGGETKILIKNNTKKGYLEATDGDGVDISSRMEYHRGTVQKGKTQTLTTMGGENNGVVVNDNNIYNLFFTIFDLCCIIDTKEKDKYERSRELLQILWEEIGKKEIWQEIRRFISIQEKKILQSNLYENELYEDRKSQSKISTSTSNSSEYNESITNREKMFNMWKNWKTRYTPQRWELSEQQFRQFNLFMQELSYETTQRETSVQDMWQTNERFRILQQTLFKIQKIWRSNENKISNGLRIRKLTPREAFRLMGVKDEDFEKCAKNQSDSSLYHLAGDSIVVNVLMAIFKEMI
jgi:DNA (cytosine-5)-methyltransferase 1